MNFLFYGLQIVVLGNLAVSLIDHIHLKCLVCRVIITELDKNITSITTNQKWRMVEVGNFRIGKDGDTSSQKVPAHRSTTFISEIIETICERMDDYVRVQYKSTGKLTIMPLMIKDENGKEMMNPESSKVKFVTDDDLNKSLKVYCEDLFSENEDEILSLYVNRPEDHVMPDAQPEICFKHTGYCKEWMIPNEEDTTWTREMAAEYEKIHGPDPYGFSSFATMGGSDFSAPKTAPEVEDFPEEEDTEESPEEEPASEIKEEL